MVAIGWVVLALALLVFTDFRYMIINALNAADFWILFVLLLFSIYWYKHS